MPGAVLHTKNAYLVGSLRDDSDQWRIQFFFFGEVKEYVILKPPIPHQCPLPRGFLNPSLLRSETGRVLFYVTTSLFFFSRMCYSLPSYGRKLWISVPLLSVFQCYLDTEYNYMYLRIEIRQTKVTVYDTKRMDDFTLSRMLLHVNEVGSFCPTLRNQPSA